MIVTLLASLLPLQPLAGRRRHPARKRSRSRKSQQKPVTPPTASQPAQSAPPQPEPLDTDRLSTGLTHLWRARRTLTRHPDGDPAVVRRDLDTAIEAFAAAGLEVQDYDGMRFLPGLSLDVLAFTPDPDATEDRVLNTVRPAVYGYGQCLQIGQVIVATPAQDPAPAQDPSPAQDPTPEQEPADD